MNDILRRVGHRNWIAVVDRAFPELVAPGVKTFDAPSLEAVILAVSSQAHLRAEAFVATELDALANDFCPGSEDLRNEIYATLEGTPILKARHEELIAMLDEAARTFTVYVVKTGCLIPYTSVFLRLGCGYWRDDQEQELGSRMAAIGGNPK